MRREVTIMCTEYRVLNTEIGLMADSKRLVQAYGGQPAGGIGRIVSLTTACYPKKFSVLSAERTARAAQPGRSGMQSTVARQGKSVPHRLPSYQITNPLIRGDGSGG